MNASTQITERQHPRASYSALLRIAFYGLPAALTLYVVYIMLKFHAVAPDFEREFWAASHRVILGLSPYDKGWMNIGGGVAYPYPALTALLFIPFALLGQGLAAALFTGLNIAAVFMILRLLEVSDRRVYGIALIWPMVIEAWQAGNLTLVLALGSALMWRKRDNPVIAGALVAVMISLKPFVWPLGLWLLATRRFAAAGYALLAGVVVNAFAWGVLGFNQLHAYNSVVNAVTTVMWRRGYEPAAIALHMGAGRSLAFAIGAVVAIVVAIAVLYVGLHGDSRSALVLAIALALLATPVLWTHYFALLLVPLALARPRLGWLWFLPLVTWVCPVNPAPWQGFVALGVCAIIIVACLRKPRERAESSQTPQGRFKRRLAISAVAPQPRPS